MRLGWDVVDFSFSPGTLPALSVMKLGVFGAHAPLSRPLSHAPCYQLARTPLCKQAQAKWYVCMLTYACAVSGLYGNTYTIPRTLYVVQCTTYTVLHAVFIVHVLRTLYHVHCTTYSVHCVMYHVHSTTYTLTGVSNIMRRFSQTLPILC